MGRAARLKSARRQLAEVAKTYAAPKAGRYTGASWWQVLVSIVWPPILDAPRAKVQAALDGVHAAAVKSATKKTAQEWSCR